MGYTRQAVKGFSWLSAFRVITRGISFLRTAIIARILTPTQFGLFGIATLVLSLIEILTETGINIFLIQRKENIDEYINTAWIVSILRGILIALAVIITSPIVAQFFNTPNAISLLLLISVVPFLRGFINPSVARFVKDLQYHKEFYYRTSIFAIESLVTIVVVLLYKTPAGLVWGLIIGAVSEIFISFILATPRPRFAFRLDMFKTVLHTGKWMTASGIFNYLYHNADNIVVGRMLGTAPFGLYDMAYRISMLPISEVSDLFGTVTLPVYVRIADDKRRLRIAYLKSVGLITAMVVPIGIIVFLFPHLIISIILGNQWLSATSLLRVLVWFGVIRAITFSSISVFYAVEQQKYVTIVTLVSVVGMLATVVPFIHLFGLMGAGLSALLGAVLATPVIVYYLMKVLL